MRIRSAPAPPFKVAVPKRSSKTSRSAPSPPSRLTTLPSGRAVSLRTTVRVSSPASPSSTSSPRPPSSRSSPAPPSSRSEPASPTSRSEASPPRRISAPAPPEAMSCSPRPSSVSAPAWPYRMSRPAVPVSTSAPRVPSLTSWLFATPPRSRVLSEAAAAPLSSRLPPPGTRISRSSPWACRVTGPVKPLKRMRSRPEVKSRMTSSPSPKA